MENKDKQKTVDIRFRVEPELKEKWNTLTKDKAVNGSELLRKYVKDWINKNQE